MINPAKDLYDPFADDQDDESPAFPPPTDVPEGDGMPFLPPPERDKAATSVPEGAPRYQTCFGRAVKPVITPLSAGTAYSFPAPSPTNH